jgi:hypothetical protein
VSFTHLWISCYSIVSRPPAARESEKQRDDEYGNENIKENLRDSRRSPRYTAKAEDRRDDGDH